MTSPLGRLTAFAAVLVLAGAGAAALGSAVGSDVDATPTESVAGGHGASAGGGHGGQERSPSSSGTSPVAGALPGLAVSQDGITLDLKDTTIAGPGQTALAFTLRDDDGSAIRDFDLAHDRRMHLVLVRRDLAGFQHLHPTMDAEGTWRVRAMLPHAGSYRVFADFTRGGRQSTLGADLNVAGRFAAGPVPAPAEASRSDRGATVRLQRDGDRITFDVRLGYRSVNDRLQPYLGARGHLVALRVGDLAYLHTHPDGDALAFETELPTAGTYRLWVQFRLDDVVHTTAFTLEQKA